MSTYLRFYPLSRNPSTITTQLNPPVPIVPNRSATEADTPVIFEFAYWFTTEAWAAADIQATTISADMEAEVVGVRFSGHCDYR